MDGKILILEDDQPFAEMLVETLDANDFAAEVSLDPGEALDRVRSGGYDLLVSDYLMPKLEGTAFIRQVREFNEAIPVLMISAYMGEAEMRQASEAGVSRVLRKPFEMKDLIGEIRQLLADRGATNAHGARADAESGGGFSGKLNHLPPVTGDSRDFVEGLWAAYRSGAPVFLTGEKGMEIDPIAAEVAGWVDPSGGTVCFDFQAAELLSPNVRLLLSRFAGKDNYARVVIGRDLDRLDRSEQKVLREALGRSDSFLRQGGQLVFLFPLDAGRLSIAEMSMDEGLLAMLFGNLVKVPPLRGRYRDIACYLRAPLDGVAPPALDAGAVAFLLRYDWPGNHGQLTELMRRLAMTRPEGAPIDAEAVRAGLEKRLVVPLEESGDPGLPAVLRERQREFLRGLSLSEKTSPERVLEAAGCVGVEPARDFPEGQEILYPDLLDAGSAS